MADYEWAQVTLWQNKKIAEIASQASKASALVDANVKFAKVALELGKVLLLAATNPQLLLLVAIADEIDNFVNDLKGTGFFVLEVTPTGNEVLPKDAEGDPISLAFSPIVISANYAAALSYYYFLANIFTFGQQYFMKRFVDEKLLLQQIEANKKRPPKPKSKFQKKLEEMQKKQEKKMRKKRN